MAPRIVVDGVTSVHVPLVWARAWPWLKKAIDRFPQIRRKITQAKLLNDLAHSRAQLWVAWDMGTNECVGALITEVTKSKKHPDKLLMEIPLVGGTEWSEWGNDIWNLIREWGLAQGCTDAVGYGRKGWQRLFGFEEYDVTQDGILIMSRSLREH